MELYFNKEKLNMTVYSSTKNNEGYTTSINIKIIKMINL